MRIKTLIIVLLLSGCASKPFIVDAPTGTEHKKEGAIIYPSYVMTPKNALGAGEQEAFIDPSIKAWNKAMGFELIKKSGSGYPITAVYVETLPAKNESADAIAYRRIDRCDVYVKHKFWSNGLDINLIIHEIGHCIGFEHSTYQPSIMWPEVDYTKLITTELRRMILESIKP